MGRGGALTPRGGQEKLHEKLMARCDLSEGCWEWNHTMHPSGYGHVYHDGKYNLAHRMSYQAYLGSIEGSWVLHRCDNPKCINPDHLFLGDAKTNVEDKVTKGRQNRGVEHAKSKLTEDMVKEIRASSESTYQLAHRLGVNPNTVWYARVGRTWKHV
jgi:hypothetical protein